MKPTLAFCAGSASVSIAVVLTGALPGWMFLLGFLVSIPTILYMCRVIGLRRVARFFLRWSLQAGRASNRFAGVGPEIIRCWRSASVNRGQQMKSGGPCADSPIDDARQTDRTLAPRGDRRRRVLRYADDAGWSSKVARRAHNPEVAGSNPAPASKPVVQSPEMLPPVQQDVLSALVNMKVPFGQAEEAVREAAHKSGGDSFDELFRTATALLSRGKSRRAAA